VKIYLDDLRPVPDGWTLAKTAGEAICLLEAGSAKALSLDHDLGEPVAEVGTGYRVAVWLEEQAHSGRWSVIPRSITIHSANPVGRVIMQAAIDSIERLRPTIGIDASQSRLEEAIALWDAEEISLGKAAKMAGISYEEMLEETGKRKLSFIRISAAELDREIEGWDDNNYVVDYYKLAHTFEQHVCFGCGRPDPGSLSTPPWPAIRDHLERHAKWSPEDLAAEEVRYQMLADAGIPIALCDDCWHCGYDWQPGETERLHARARRFAGQTESGYMFRRANRVRWGRNTHVSDRRRRLLRAALFRWDDVWLLNNPGFKLPYEVAR
jgi:predicted HTH domain antitoxin